MFKFLLEKILCKHQWKLIDEVEIYENNDYDFNYHINESLIEKERPIYLKKMFVCEKCGKFKVIKL